LIGQLVFNGTLAHFTRDGLAEPFAGAPFLVAAACAILAIIALSLVPTSKAPPKP